MLQLIKRLLSSPKVATEKVPKPKALNSSDVVAQEMDDVARRYGDSPPWAPKGDHPGHSLPGTGRPVVS